MATRRSRRPLSADAARRAADARVLSTSQETPDGRAPDVDGQDTPTAFPEDAPADTPRQTALSVGSIGRASLAVRAPLGRTLFASRAFFDRAAEELWASTEHGIELSGAVYAQQDGHRMTLVGLKRCASGEPGRVEVNPSWGKILWHTHPGLRGSLAAFSGEDVEAARIAGRPLLVIGFGGLSPDVLTTLALPLGLKSMLVGAGIKGLLTLEKNGVLTKRLLRLGVAARVCYPNGEIRPVHKRGGSPMERAVEDMSFALDRSMGAIERVGQAAAKRAIEELKNLSGR